LGTRGTGGIRLGDVRRERRLIKLVEDLAAQPQGSIPLARSLGVHDRVRFAGWQPQPGPLYELADLVVCPSRHEPLGNVILEAWSHTKPVLSTATDGALELINDNDNGLLAPCADPEKLAARLQDVLTAPESERRRLGLAGQGTLRRDHSRAAVVGQYLDLYAALRIE
jgi:glycosyltransferase involved in cell wall biosynthesis